MQGQGFNILQALGLFFIYFVIDFLYAKYVMYIQKRKSLLSALSSIGLTGLSFFGYYEFIKQPFYVIPILLGVGLGTFLTVKYGRS